MANSTSGPEHPLPNRIHKGKQKGRDHVGQERLHNRGIMSYWFLQQIHKDNNKKNRLQNEPLWNLSFQVWARNVIRLRKSKSDFKSPSHVELQFWHYTQFLRCSCSLFLLITRSERKGYLATFKHGYFQFVNNLHFFCLDLWKNE